MFNPNKNITHYISIYYICIALFVFPKVLTAQFFINGANVHTLGNSIVIVKTDSFLIDNNGSLLQEGLLVIERDLIVNDGKLEVDGTIDIENDFLNNDSTLGLSPTSFILLNGNWTNNSTFIPGLNTTELDGSNQIIDGSQNTNFYNLFAIGNVGEIKRLVGVNASVLNQLDLTDVEFATDQNNLSVYNPNASAIIRNDGFVSSLDTGKLERATNSNSAYLFPTGSSIGTLRYRPITIGPTSTTLDTFGVRLANVDPGSEGFDVLRLSDSLCAVNPNFYHRIYGTSTANITMFYIPTEDGEWDAMAQWQDINLWDKLPNEVQSTSGQFSRISIPNWSDYENPAFALGVSNPSLDLEDTLIVNEGNDISLQPIYTGSNPESFMWWPIENLDCPNCLETNASPLENTWYNLEVTVTQNCIIRDSILIILNPAGLYLPTGFSPNMDGTNDYFIPLNDNLETYAISIYNRWGELVYSSNDFTVGWDGTYKGKKAGIGVYTYSAEYKFLNQTATENFSGNVTLIR